MSCSDFARENPKRRLGRHRTGEDGGILLNATHRYGASKARFFAAFGFSLEQWPLLAAALHDHARQHEVSRVRETGFGPRYEVEGALTAPDGRRPHVHAVWQMGKGQLAPRLITAYPLEP